jgi:FHA domain
MILEYLKPIGAPFVAIKNKIFGAKTKVGTFKVEMNRVKGYGAEGKGYLNKANKVAGGAQGQAAAAGQGAQQQMQQMGGGAPGAPQAAPGMPGAPPGAVPGGIDPNPPIRQKGFWVFKKKFCTQCGQQLDTSWDACPYCAQAAQQAAAANKPKAAPMKTQAFMIDSGGAGPGMQLLGWLVPVQGPQRGELFTLSPASVIGKDPSCTIVLQDGYMSSRHAEIKAEGGIWVLKDMGSTNGTYVNDKRVDKQELVDNDMIMFGKCLVKFKSL